MEALPRANTFEAMICRLDRHFVRWPRGSLEHYPDHSPPRILPSFKNRAPSGLTTGWDTQNILLIDAPAQTT